MRRKWLLLCIVLLAVGIAVAALIGYDVFGLRPTRCEVRRVTTEELAFYLARQLGLDAVEFEYTMPDGVQITAWVATYIDGKLDEELSYHFISSAGHKTNGKPWSGSFTFRRYYPEYTSEAPSERCRWEFVPCNCGGVKWVNNPFRNLASWGRGPHTDIWDLKLGQTEVVYYHCGETEETQKEGMIGYPGHVDPAKEAEMIEHYDVCVFIKVRFDKARGPARLYISQPGLPHFPDEE